MFLSPISPASVWTSAASSARKAISAAESGAAAAIFFSDILIPNHQSKKKKTTTPSAMRSPLRHNRRKMLFFNSSDLLSEAQGADAEKDHGHDRHDGERGPVFEEARAAQNDSAHERDEIRSRKKGADRVENPGHRFARENKTGEEHARENEGHAHLQRLHLILRFRGHQQSDAEKREEINQRRENHRDDAARDRHGEDETHDAEKQNGHDHSDAKIWDQFAQHQAPAAERTHEQLFERAALALAHDGHGRGERRADLQDDADDPRHEKVRAPHRGIVKHLWP